MKLKKCFKKFKKNEYVSTEKRTITVIIFYVHRCQEGYEGDKCENNIVQETGKFLFSLLEIFLT